MGIAVASIVKDDDEIKAKKTKKSVSDTTKKSIADTTDDKKKKKEISSKRAEDVTDQEEKLLLSLIKGELEKRFSGRSHSQADHTLDTNELMKRLAKEVEDETKEETTT